MARTPRLLFSLVVAAALAAPSLAEAQAIPRPRGGSTTGSGGGSSGGSSGGASGGSTSSGGSSTAPAPRIGSSSGSSRTPSRIPPPGARRASAVSRTSARERPAPAPGGVVSSGSASVRSGDASNRTGAIGSASSQVVGRDRSGRPVTGFAAARPVTELDDVRLIAFPLFGPWGRWYPWAGSGFGYRFLTYDPWYYGATRWYWGRYGMWYDPYSYYPNYYDDRYYGGRYEREEDPTERRFGSIRIKADPKTAKVYVNGALVGIVDEFDGLTDHLELEAGAHQLELRAEGYETFITDVTVEPDKVRTERISLKKVK